MIFYFEILGAVFLTSLLIAFLLILSYLLYMVLTLIKKGSVPSKCVMRIHTSNFGKEDIKEYNYESLFSMYENLCTSQNYAVFIDSYSELAYRDFLEEDSK